jgi:hypothetical protein
MTENDHAVLATGEPLVDDHHPARWAARGLMVGAALGLSAGSIIPLLGTAVGGAAGTAAGLGIGLAMSGFAALTRAVFPASPRAVEIRERVACLAIIWSVYVWLAFVGPDMRAYSWMPLLGAILGSIHTLAAGTPTRTRTYTGQVSVLRRRICNWLPWLILGVIATGWIIAWTWLAINARR